MKKDEALALRERMRTRADEAARKAGYPTLAEDGKLYHDEVDDWARWAQRWTLAGRWPHAGPAEGRPARPGLRYEAWYFPGKQKEETIWLMALCDGGQDLAPLQAHMAPAFEQLITGGKYARRYTALDARVKRLYPEAIGFMRQVPLAKALDALAQLLDDSLKPLETRFAAFEGADQAASSFEAASGAFDPFAALKQRFK